MTVPQPGPLNPPGCERFEEALPARPFRFEKGLQSFAGWWYFAKTGTHIGFESWLERDHLMLMDFDPGVRAVVSQQITIAAIWERLADEHGAAIAYPTLRTYVSSHRDSGA